MMELMRMGIPSQGVNVVFDRILKLSEFSVEGAPSVDEIESLADQNYLDDENDVT